MIMEEKNINTEEEVKTDDVTVDETTDEVAEETATSADDVEVAEDVEPEDDAMQQIADLKDKYLRQVAEFDNYRKRTLKERAELILNGGEKTDDPQILREGMQLIYQKLMKVLEAQGVSKIETTDADFDTNLHEAVALVPGMGDDKKGKVIDCMATGYKLNDKVIRYAKVAVGQ